jgi:flagellar hook assembly protein FlgD
VFDSRGQLVRTLLQAESGAGRHEVTWDGRDVRGLRLASGSYFLRMRAGDRMATCRMVLLK